MPSTQACLLGLISATLAFGPARPSGVVSTSWPPPPQDMREEDVRRRDDPADGTEVEEGESTDPGVTGCGTLWGVREASGVLG